MEIHNFITANELIFQPINLSLDSEGKKIISGSHKGWNKKDHLECIENFKSYKDKFNSFQIVIGYDYLIFDTDEELQYKTFVEYLKSMDKYEPEAITKSFRGKLYDIPYKNHFYFSVSKDDIIDYTKPTKPLIDFTKQYNGWDLIYGRGYSYELKDNTLNLSKIPNLSKDEFMELFSIMTGAFPKEELITLKMLDSEKVNTDEEIITTPKIISKYKMDSGKITEEKLRIICDNIADYRWNFYDDWIRLAMIFINEKLPLEIFKEYSKSKCPEKYDDEKNDKLIDNISHKLDTGLTIASLYYYLKIDNIRVFHSLQDDRSEFWEFLSRLNDNDCAKFYYNHNKNKYIYSYETGWYEYESNKMLNKVATPKNFPFTLHSDIADFFQNYLDEQKKCLKLGSEDGKSKYAILDKCYSKFGKSRLCKDVASFLPKLYNKSGIGEKIDANDNLLCFKDKVFDLTIGDFRDIEEKDYLSFSTKIEAPDFSETDIFHKIGPEDKKFYYFDYTKLNEDELFIINTLESIFVKDKVKINIDLEGKKTIERKLDDKDYEGKMMVKYWFDTTATQLFNFKYENIYIHNGYGGNGKGVLSYLIEHSLGDYYKSPNSSFLNTKPDSGKADPALSSLKGVRYCCVAEPEGGNGKLQKDVMKKLSDPGKQTSRLLHENLTEWVPQFTLNIQCNAKPEIDKGADDGIQRRLKIIKYPFRFTSDKNDLGEIIELSDYEKPVNVNLKNKLVEKKNKKAFLGLLLKSVLPLVDRVELDDENNKKVLIKQIITPKIVKDEVIEYMEDNNILLEFLNSELMTGRITKKREDKIDRTKLYDEFITFMKGKVISRPKFYEALFNSKFEMSRGGSVRYIVGIKPPMTLISDNLDIDM